MSTCFALLCVTFAKSGLSVLYSTLLQLQTKSFPGQGKTVREFYEAVTRSPQPNVFSGAKFQISCDEMLQVFHDFKSVKRVVNPDVVCH